MTEVDMTVPAKHPRAIKEAAVEWRLRLSSGMVSSAERADFDAWLQSDPRHAEAYDRAAGVYAALGTLKRGDIEPRYFEPSSGYRLRAFWAGLKTWCANRPRGLASAVLAGFAAAAFLVLLQPPQTLQVNGPPVVTAFSTGVGETKTVTLTDQSVLTLGAGTAIEVGMSNDLRQATLLKGAAMFDVTPDADRPFLVKAEALTARVVGTVFDVRSNGGVVRLSVNEGIVEAVHPLMIDGKSMGFDTLTRLMPGQRIIATQTTGLSDVSGFRQESFAAWRKDRLRYKGATLAELVADANRYSAQPILLNEALSGLAQARVALSFDGKDIDSMLATLPEMFPVAITEDDKARIVISERAP
ncbi:MAG: FecR domain-containing protein [Pseudomonadota bacterium]